ncbi:MAG TPA: M36 family metallopeptidase [Pyrinomonadaceae bacterium]|jgi:hypothetical protein
MKTGLREERKGLLLSFLTLGLIGALAVLPSQFRSTANEDNQEPDGRAKIENYDIRKDKSAAALNARAEFRAASGKPEMAAAEDQEKIVANEKALRERFPSLEIKYNEELDNAAIIAPRIGLGRASAKLTAPSTAKRPDNLRSFAKTNNDLLAVTDSQVDNLKVTADYTNPNGELSFVHLEQEINGIPVFQGELKAGFTKRGEIIRVINNLAPGLEYNSLSSDFGSPEDAVRAAFKQVSRPMKDEEATRNAASTEMKAVFGTGDWATTAEKMYFPTEAGVARPAWRVSIWESAAAYYVIVDAETGTMLWRKNLTNHQTQPATYNVYANTTSLLKSLDSPAPLSPGPTNPEIGNQGFAATRTNVTLIGNEAPYTFNQKGWITDNTNATEGNNVRAGLDRAEPDGIDDVITGSPDRIFESPMWNPPPGTPGTIADDPVSQQAQRGAVIQMFYVVNRFHDETYRLGFTESARNFQHQNFTGSGAPGDRILAEGQDTDPNNPTFNNANFTTEADGGRGKMQMYLWNGPNPDRDGTADAEIMVHELTHGLSNRLHSNASGLNSSMGQAMGEGWSDFYALSMLSETTDPINGVYALAGYSTYLRVTGFGGNYYYGIRRFPKAVMAFTGGPNNRPHNGLTFKHLNSNCNEVIDSISAYKHGQLANNQICDDIHNAGEIWSSALWEVRAKFIQQYGHSLGTRLVLQYVTDGMKLDPSSPTMLDARNSIIAAAANGPNPDLDVALVWQGFAIRGMGYSASIQNASIGALVTEAFDLPNVSVTNNFSFTDAAPGGDGDGFAEPGETLVLTVPVTNPTGSTITAVTVSANSGASVNYGDIANGATVTRTMNYLVPGTIACGSNLVLNFNINGSAGSNVVTRTLRIGAPVFGFQQNFDAVTAPNLPAGWTQTVIGSNIGWKTVTASPDSAPNSAFTPDPATAGGADLISPVFTLNSTDAILNFRHKYDTENGWDGGVLEISISGGAFKDITEAGGMFLAGGYNGTVTSAAYGTPLAGRNIWTGNSNGYITTSIQLPASASGVAIQLKWRMGHDNSNPGASYTGWNIDNIAVINSYRCNDEPPPPPAFTTRADFDGDTKTDRVVFRNGAWHQLRSQNSQFFTVNWGIPSDIPVSGDFDGDRKADPAVFRSGAWYVMQSSNNTMYAANWGAPGDIPVPADYTGDGKDDFAIFRNGLWAVYPTGGGTPIYQAWGIPGDKPVAGKYDNDAKTDLAVFRAGNWYILTSSSNTFLSANWGVSSDTLVPGDYNGDGIDETAVFRNGTWYIRTLTGEISSIPWGQAGDIPVPGDYDGDRRLDAAVFRPSAGAWYVLATTSGFNGVGWGQAGDTPIPANYTK